MESEGRGHLFPRMPKSLLISITALMAALCSVLTMMFQIYVPATTGYFNFGEIGVYISAVLFGPIVGGFAGGVGSMIADILLGYPHYAIATLIIKGAEGFLVGYLSHRFRNQFAPQRLRYLGVFIGVGLALSLGIIGWFRFSGELFISGGPETNTWWLSLIILPSWVWFILAIFIGITTILITIRYEPNAAWDAMAMLLGGCLMLTGYFLYQQFIFVTPQSPLIEVPANLMQSIIGILVALPVTDRVRRVFKNSTWLE